MKNFCCFVQFLFFFLLLSLSLATWQDDRWVEREALAVAAKIFALFVRNRAIRAHFLLTNRACSRRPAVALSTQERDLKLFRADALRRNKNKVERFAQHAQPTQRDVFHADRKLFELVDHLPVR